MEFSFSKHALEQIEHRGITLQTAYEVLQSPDHVIEQGDKRIYQSVISENGKQYLIRIFVNKDKIPQLVITAYKTSKISKYYECEI